MDGIRQFLRCSQAPTDIESGRNSFPSLVYSDLEHLHFFIIIIIYSLTDPASSAAADHTGGSLGARIVYSSINYPSQPPHNPFRGAILSNQLQDADEGAK